MSHTELSDKPDQQLEKDDMLLRMFNGTVDVLLATKEEGDNFETSILQCMELIGRSLDVDRVQIWRNETEDDVLYFVHAYEWLSDIGREKPPVPIGLRFSYRDKPEWKNKFLRGEYINGPLSELSPDDQELLRPYDIWSVVIIPLFLHDTFWGFFSIDDCRQERVFNEDEIGILRSLSSMMAAALIRIEQAARTREEHERIRNLLDAVPLMVSLWDKNSTLVECNEEYLKVFKVKDKRELLEHFFDFSPKYQPGGQPTSVLATVHIKKAFAEGRCVLEWMHQLPDGTPIPVEITLVRVRFGEESFVAGYARDLREHRHMVEQIAQQGNLLSTVNEVAAILFQAGIDEFERDLRRCMGMMGRAVGVDRVSIWKNHVKDERLYCSRIHIWYDGPELQLDNEAIIVRAYDEAFPGWEEMISHGKCINSLMRSMPPETQADLKSLGILSLFVVPVFVRRQFWGFVCFSDCRHERTLSVSEESIVRSGSLMIANALQRTGNVAEMIRLQTELGIALKDAEEANRTKSGFLAQMSHEMRTPLNAIIGLSELILEDRESKGEDCSDLQKIYSAGMTLLSTVNDILDISKIEAGKFEIVPVEYDIPSLLNDTITQNILRTGDRPTITFSLNIDENLPTSLYGDELRIKQIFNNLLSNAFKYTRQGTVELEVSCAREGETVWMICHVRDSGIGIREEDMDELFVDYGRLDLRSNRGIDGTGLGLAIVKRIVDMMGGSIVVESEYGKGSVFTVRIPQRAVTDAVIGREIVQNLKNFSYSVHKRHRNSKLVRISLPYARVLVVDDIPTNLDVVKGMMKPYGMQVDCVTSGQQAIDAIRAEKVRYNAVFMDHAMPEMDGIEAARIIREKIGTEYAKNIPIIAFTANAIAGSKEMFLRKGFQGFLSKPIELIQLDAVIRQWVRDKKLEQLFADRQISGYDQVFLDTRSGQERRTVSSRRNEFDQRCANESIPGLHMNKGLERFGGDAEAYLHVLHSYTANTQPLLETVRGVNRANLADYAIVVHGIKGSSRSIGADLVGDKAEALEKAAKAGYMDFVEANNASFIDSVDALLGGLNELLRRMASENPKPKKDRPDEHLLSRLLTACEHYDMDNVDTVMAELEGSEYEADDGLVAWLRENVEMMNIAQIKEKLLSMIK